MPPVLESMSRGRLTCVIIIMTWRLYGFFLKILFLNRDGVNAEGTRRSGRRVYPGMSVGVGDVVRACLERDQGTLGERRWTVTWHRTRPTYLTTTPQYETTCPRARAATDPAVRQVDLNPQNRPESAVRTVALPRRPCWTRHFTLQCSLIGQRRTS